MPSLNQSSNLSSNEPLPEELYPLSPDPEQRSWQLQQINQLQRHGLPGTDQGEIEYMEEDENP